MRFRNLLQGLCTAALLISLAAVRAQNGADQVVEVAFTPDMDKAALERIKEEVKAKGVGLTYDVVEFNGDLLHQIAFSVITPDCSGKADGDIKPDVRYGFRYDPRPGVEVSFGVGSLDRMFTEPVPGKHEQQHSTEPSPPIGSE